MRAHGHGRAHDGCGRTAHPLTHARTIPELPAAHAKLHGTSIPLSLVADMPTICTLRAASENSSFDSDISRRSPRSPSASMCSSSTTTQQSSPAKCSSGGGASSQAEWMAAGGQRTAHKLPRCSQLELNNQQIADCLSAYPSQQRANSQTHSPSRPSCASRFTHTFDFSIVHTATVSPPRAARGCPDSSPPAT